MLITVHKTAGLVISIVILLSVRNAHTLAFIMENPLQALLKRSWLFQYETVSSKVQITELFLRKHLSLWIIMCTIRLSWSLEVIRARYRIEKYIKREISKGEIQR
ncbi:unnamed protein product [Schistosoma turkestanicum]|nr:unnamed protein product [Schistosoma turkestanicum]